MIEILEARIGEKCLLEGKCQVEGFMEMTFTLRESQYGYWIQLTKSFKCDDGKFRNSIWLNKNECHKKAIDIFEKAYHKLIGERAAELERNQPQPTVLDRVRGPAEQTFTKDDIPF